MISSKKRIKMIFGILGKNHSRIKEKRKIVFSKQKVNVERMIPSVGQSSVVHCQARQNRGMRHAIPAFSVQIGHLFRHRHRQGPGERNRQDDQVDEFGSESG
jgi:hypothetical protein